MALKRVALALERFDVAIALLVDVIDDPHDAKVREWGSGRSRLETLRMLGRKPRVVPMHSLQDGINAARLTIPLARFDATRCARGIDRLKSYEAEWSEELRCFKKTPLHNWASHEADGWRYLSMAWREPMSAEDVVLDPIAELLKPRTWADIWAMRAEELRGQDVELDEFADDFNLSNTLELN